MSSFISIAIELSQRELLRGQSTSFQIVVRNESGQTLRDVATLDAANRTIGLRLEGNGRPIFADAASAMSRDGQAVSQQREAETTTLAARQTMEVQEDLLSWSGELAPGTYELVAGYEHGALRAVSAPVPLRILPARAVSVSGARLSQRTASAALPLACVRKTEQGYSLLMQSNSPYVPRNMWESLAIADLDGNPDVWPAESASLTHPVRHVVWQIERKLHAAFVTTTADRKVSIVEIRTPFRGRPLASPRSTSKGELLIPFVDESGERFAVIHVDGRGNSVSRELSPTAPIGPYCCYWEETFLHLLWAASQGWDVHYARLPLLDPAAPFVQRCAHMAHAPVLNLDAFLDFSSALRETEHDDDRPVRPELTMLCLSAAGCELELEEVRLYSGGRKTIARAECSAPSPLRALSSAITADQNLAVILADSAGGRHYFHSARSNVEPLAQLPSDASFALLPASATAVKPWLHLAFVDPQSGAFQYTRLEPQKTPDPIERIALSRKQGSAR